MAIDDSATTGTSDPAGHHHLLQFLRGLSGLDDALGRWRPDYGGLAARDAPDPGASGDVTPAHRQYSIGLRYFADHPELAWALGEPSRDDVAAAIADARLRFGAPIVPLEELIRGSDPARAGRARVVEGYAGDGGSPFSDQWDQGATALPYQAAHDAPRPFQPPAPPPVVEEHPWAEPAAPLPSRPPVDGESSRRPPGSRLALAVGIAALLVTGLIVAIAVVAAHYFLGPGPTAGPAEPTPAPTPPPSSVATVGPLPTLFAPAESCSAIPTGQVPASLSITSTASGIGTDPATGFGTPYVSITLASPVRQSTPSLALITAVLPYSATAPTSGSPIDRAGQVQLVAGWEGGDWYGGLRSWSAPAWSSLSDPSSAPVDVTQNGDVVTVYWNGLTNGDKYGVVLATSAGCTALDLSGGTSPTATYAG